MKLYAVINKNEFVGDAYVICTEIKSAKNAFDNYTVNPGRTILAEIEHVRTSALMQAARSSGEVRY